MSRTWINECVSHQEAVTLMMPKLSATSHLRPYLIQGMAVAGVS